MSHKSQTLQIAQIVADLQTLQNADPTAATHLLTTQKSLASTTRSPSTRRNSALKSAALSKRLAPLTATKAPSFTRESSIPTSRGASTPVPGSVVETDPDLARAQTLLSLFEMRGKFKQMGDTGLTRAKERVDEVVARYARKELEERERVARARHLGVGGS